jgi:hypothetical protein
MDPDKMRQCMSLGYSVKSKIANTIGQCKFGQSQYAKIFWLNIDAFIILNLLPSRWKWFQDKYNEAWC